MNWMPDAHLLLALASGIVLAATCGLRAFLPLLALGLAARFGGLALTPSMAWLRDDLALVALAVATVAEIAGDKIPTLDHVLDMLGMAVRPLAAAFGSYALLSGWPHPWGPLVAIALGGLALGVQGVKAKTRLGSSALTLGHANPLLSAAEDALAVLGSVLAVVVPVIALTLLAIAVWLIAGRRRRAPHAVAPRA